MLSLCKIEKARLVVRNDQEIARLMPMAPGVGFFTIDQYDRARGCTAPILFDPDAVGLIIASLEREIVKKGHEADLAYAEGLLFCIRALSVGHVIESKREIRENLYRHLGKSDKLAKDFEALCIKKGWTVDLP
jgi:hypothetical protein